MNNFTFLTPPRIEFGSGSIERVGEATAALGRRALLVTGRRAMAASGTLDRVRNLLRSSGVDVEVFDRVAHDPCLATVDAGVAVAREHGSDVVVGLGGGSPLDAAKAMAALADKDGSAQLYFSGERDVDSQGLPFVAAPTTSGTGAEITKNAVLTDRESNVKKSLRSPHMVATVAIVDPELTLSAPSPVTAYSGMDALTQAMECYLSRAANPISDALALAAVRQILPHLEPAVADGADLWRRESLAMGSLLTGMAFANASLGAVHGLAHPLGLALGMPHGLVCAVLLPVVLEYNRTMAEDRFRTLAHHAGLASAEDMAPFLRLLGDKIGIPASFSGYGLNASHLPYILANCRSGSMRNNPRDVPDEDIEKLLAGLM